MNIKKDVIPIFSRERKTKEELIKELMDDPEVRDIVNREIDLELMETERLLKESKPHEFSDDFNQNIQRLLDETTDKDELLEEWEELWQTMIEEDPELAALSNEIDEFTNSLPKEVEEPKETYHEFMEDVEDKIEKRIKRITRQPVHPKFFYYLKLVYVRQACVYIASSILLFILATMVFSYTDATALPKFFVQITQNTNNDNFDVTLELDPSIPLHTNLYEPSWLPRGYNKVNTSLENTFYLIEYKTDTGNYIKYEQSNLANYQLATNTQNINSETIDGITYFYNISDTYIGVVWIDNNHEYLLEGTTDLQTLLKMAKKTQKKGLYND